MRPNHDDRFPPPVARRSDDSWKKYPRGAWIVFGFGALALIWGATGVGAALQILAGGLTAGVALEAAAGFLFGLFVFGVLLFHFKPWRRGWL